MNDALFRLLGDDNRIEIQDGGWRDLSRDEAATVLRALDIKPRLMTLVELLAFVGGMVALAVLSRGGGA